MHCVYAHAMCHSALPLMRRMVAESVHHEHLIPLKFESLLLLNQGSPLDNMFCKNIFRNHSHRCNCVLPTALGRARGGRARGSRATPMDYQEYDECPALQSWHTNHAPLVGAAACALRLLSSLGVHGKKENGDKQRSMLPSLSLLSAMTCRLLRGALRCRA